MDYQRYQRHFSLFGLDGQEKINNASVLIVGCGGVGSPVSLYLTAAGVGKIGLVDDDVVDLSNLQRQILFNETDINKSKVKQAEECLHKLNSTTLINTYNERLTIENAKTIFQEYDLIIDGSDNYKTRFLVNDVCAIIDKPFISASVLQNMAHLAFFDIVNGCYRCFFPEPPQQGLIPNCAEAGVLGSVVGVIGTMAATMALNYFLKEDMPIGILKVFDAKTLQWRDFSFAKNSDCKSCIGKELKLEHQNENNSQIVAKLDLSDINLDDFFLLDVRTEWERDLVKIDNDDEHVPVAQLLTTKVKIPKNKKILCYCKTGLRSQKAAAILLENGYKAFSLDGGINKWLEEQGKALCY